MIGTSDTLNMLSGMGNPFERYMEGLDAYEERLKEVGKTKKEIDEEEIEGERKWIKVKQSAAEKEKQIEAAKFENKRSYFDFIKGLREDASEQERDAAVKDLNTQAQLAGNLSEIATVIYKQQGSQSREMFFVAKAAAVAEAIINVATGITAAYKLGPWGVPLALTIGALGAIQIATIMSTGLAAGGPVEGYSPSKTADNIWVRATAGEFFHPVDSVQYYGRGVMEGIKTRSIPREIFAGLSLPGSTLAGNKVFQAGGLVGETPILAGPGERTEITMVNITDPREIDRFLATPAGQNAILNVLSSRRASVQRIIR